MSGEKQDSVVQIEVNECHKTYLNKGHTFEASIRCVVNFRMLLRLTQFQESKALTL